MKQRPMVLIFAGVLSGTAVVWNIMSMTAAFYLLTGICLLASLIFSDRRYGWVADGKLALAICNKCFEKGLIMERAGRDNNVLKLMPALVATDDELIRGLDIIRDSMNELM